MIADSPTLSPQYLAQRLLALPTLRKQQRLLTEHASQLGQPLAAAIKEEADRVLHTDLERSLQMAELLLFLGQLTDDARCRALGLLAKANATAIGLGDFQGGLTLCDEAAAIYQAEGDVIGHARVQITSILPLARLGRIAEVHQVGEEAARVLAEHEEFFALAKLYVNLAGLHYHQRADNEALRLYDQAQAIYDKLARTEDVLKARARVMQNKAVIFHNLGQFEEAIRVNLQAEQLLQQTRQTLGVARARKSRALTYFELGQYNDALYLLDKAREVFLAHNAEEQAIAVDLSICSCLLNLQRFTDVLARCTEASTFFLRRNASHEIAQTHFYKGVAYAGLRRFTEANDALTAAKQWFATVGSQVWIALTDLELAVIARYQQRFAACLTTAEACTAIFQENGLDIEAARSQLVLAQAALALHQPDRARRHVNAARAVGEAKKIPALTLQAHHLHGLIARAQESYPQALRDFDRALAKLEQLRGHLMVEFRVDFLADKEEIYQDIVDLCLDLNRPKRALAYAERAKSRVLQDMLAFRLDLGVKARVTEDQHLVDTIFRLRQQRDRLYPHAFGNVMANTTLSNNAVPNHADNHLRSRTLTQEPEVVQQEVSALEERITALWHKLLIRNANHALNTARHEISAAQVQPHLDADTLLVEFFISHGKLIVFLISRKDVWAQRLTVDLNHVQRLTQLLRLNLRSVPNSTPARQPSLTANAQGILRQLHSLLIAPITDALRPYSRLIFVPHQVLHYLPLHALYDGTRYLLERYQISYLPGANVLQYCKDVTPTAAGMLAIGHAHNNQLPQAVIEAQGVAALFGADALCDAAATRASVQAAAGNYRLLHIATHGEFRTDNPLFSGLALDDGWLTTLDIFNLRFNASLVTLSACHTGRSVIGSGDELLGLSRALLHAGCASLLLCQWAVEDCSTARLMQDFYHRLVAGATKGAALRATQRRVMRTANGDGTFTDVHPYYWASAYLVGDDGIL